MRLNEEKAKAIRIQQAKAEVDAWFAEQVEAGYTSPDLGIRLGMKPEDVTLLTGAFVLAKEAASLGLGVPPLIDLDGKPHELDIATLTSVMIGYGQHRAAVSTEYASRVSALTKGETK